MIQPSPDPAVRGSVLKRFLPILILIAGLVAFFAFGGHRYVGFDTLEKHREALMALVAEHGFAAVLGFIVIYAVMVAFSIPGALVMTVTSGFLFGTLGGAACSVVGATLGSIALFLAARTAIGGLLRDKAGPALAKMKAGFQEDALSYLLVLRLIPIFPFFIVNLVPAFLGVTLRVFAIATFIGIIPGSFVYATVGAGLGSIFDSGEEFSAGSILTPEIVTALIGLAVLAMLPVAYKKFRAKRGR